MKDYIEIFNSTKTDGNAVTVELIKPRPKHTVYEFVYDLNSCNFKEIFHENRGDEE